MSIASKKEVTNLFDKKIKPRLGRLEKVRSEILSHYFKIAILSLVAYAVLLQKFGVPLGDVRLWGIVFVCLFLFWKRQTRAYRRKFKKNIIEAIFNVLIEDCHYKHEQYVSSSCFDESEIVRSSYNEYTGDDFVSGKIGNIPVEFSDLQIVKVAGSGRNRRRVTVFKGLFFKFKLRNNFFQKTLILDDQTEKFLGKTIGRFVQKSLSPENRSLVQLESTEFERLFTVYSNDQIKSRVLLSPTVISNLINFKKKYRQRLDLSLKDDCLYVAIHSYKNHFEPSFFGKVVGLKEIREIYDLFKLVYQLQEDLGVTKAS